MQVEFFLLVLSLLFFVSIIADKIGNKFGVPALLLFLVVGMLFGAGGLGIVGDGSSSLDIGSAEAISTIAMCIILFSGGMDTKLSDIKSVLAPGITLATMGVLITCVITGVIIYFIFGWIHAVASVGMSMALLIAATMSSTDSASVFSIMRTHNIGLKHNLRPLLELESGANDPMAYVLTTTLIGVVVAETSDISALAIAQNIIVQLVMGSVLGLAFGEGLVLLFKHVRLANEALYPIMVLTACIFIFAMTYYLKGNTYLAVYVGGIIIGNAKFTRKRQTKAFFNGLTWLSQLLMFLMLGLMVRPADFLRLEVWLPCLIISIVMIFVSRPLSVWLCMWPFKKYLTRDKIMISWVGLKGAVPIIFAILCQANGVPNADIIFNMVFLCTIISLLVQGTTLTLVADKLNLDTPPDEAKQLEHFDLDLPDEIQSTAHELEVTDSMLASGNTLREMQIPPHTLIVMVRRDDDFFVPTGTSELQKGDQMLVITDQDANEVYQQIINEAEEEAQWREGVRRSAKERLQRLHQWAEERRAKAANRVKERKEEREQKEKNK
ncbi:MAG: potassium/proton antiporter [Paludibacteraceae bacterium]|nr:potassium/proton antiporter [Paludibacteraceae bacterium]